MWLINRLIKIVRRLKRSVYTDIDDPCDGYCYECDRGCPEYRAYINNKVVRAVVERKIKLVYGKI